ncbi:HAMP domain-containing sensor histidine kinase [Sphingomicrobium sp. XHP0239]|uniref:sensor histidine kinase n=1 Tax=Sphingomicrobium maritimum TaxID=3133972 RepID=UPI0031CC610B
MRFDDRLATLLTLPLAGPRDRAVRWRQLVELAARVSEAGMEDDAPMVAALAVIRSERDEVPIDVRSATGRAIAGRALGPKMLALFAEEELSVAAPVLAAASVKPEQRAALVDAADGATRAFLLNLWPDQDGADAESRRLGDVVERLKAARTTIGDAVDGETPSVKSPQPDGNTGTSDKADGANTAILDRETVASTTSRPSARSFSPSTNVDRDAIKAFRWETGADGAIDWVDGAPRTALIGQSLAAAPALAPLIGARQSFSAVDSAFAGLPGDWQVTGTPEYDPESGRFLGYSGAALRKRAAASRRMSPPRETALPLDPAALRELVHEIKTPLNAIIGFAEIIDGQYLGPAHRRYRERAAQIVTQARILLEAIKDLDFAARLQGGREEGDAEPLGDILNHLRPVIEARAARRGVDLDIPRDRDPVCSTNAELSARLLERLIAALIDVTPHGETLSIAIGAKERHCYVAIERPRGLDRYDERELFDPGFSIDDDDDALLGLGFSLRLVRGLARVAGGDLVIDDRHLTLSLVRAD